MEWFTNVPVKTQDGRTLRFYDDVMKGKILLINFFFTECDDALPAGDREPRPRAGAAGRSRRQGYLHDSISLQPEHDTPEVMAAYARSHGVGPGWLFLTGQKRRYRAAAPPAWASGISIRSMDADPEQHLGTVRIANEPMHRWTMSPACSIRRRSCGR